MKLYLSSYLFGNESEQLKILLPAGARIGHINNAKDWVGADEELKKKSLQEEMEFLNRLGFISEHLDLKDYFGKTKALKERLDELDALWVCGGNTFVLRQAMKLSGFDSHFEELLKRNDFLWAGYSAGICILCDSLKYIEQVDDPHNFPYDGISEALYDGLGLFPFALLPHYDSDHFESEAINAEIQRCIDNKWLFKALKDGEVKILKDSRFLI